ncbi:MAG: hypothetical protein ACQEP5_10395 [Actinomycetota bacterium]
MRKFCYTFLAAGFFSFFAAQRFIFAASGAAEGIMGGIRFDPLYSVPGVLLLGGIIVMVRIWLSKRRITRWKHVWGSRTRYRREER